MGALCPAKVRLTWFRILRWAVLGVVIAESSIDGSRGDVETLRDNRVAETQGAQFDRLGEIDFVILTVHPLTPIVKYSF